MYLRQIAPNNFAKLPTYYVVVCSNELIYYNSTITMTIFRSTYIYIYISSHDYKIFITLCRKQSGIYNFVYIL